MIRFFPSALVIVIGSLSGNAWAFMGGMNLSETDDMVYDAGRPGENKLPAQYAVDRLKALGFKQIVLNPRAQMKDPFGSEIIPVIASQYRRQERERYVRLMNYIHSQGLTVGIRPIFFLVKPDGAFPYLEKQPNGTLKTWWHGNIEPKDPDAWFESFKAYLDIYLLIAKFGKADSFTMGSELYSMTVGIEDQWKEHPHGFPGRWLALLKYVKTKLSAQTQVMYDINFTDDSILQGGVGASGGELERWRYRLVDLASPKDPDQEKIWKDLVQFWSELDFIGIDMYRSFATPTDVLPSDYNQLVDVLGLRANRFASQLDSTLIEIESVTGVHKKVVFKEVGFRSVDRGFVNPFQYTSSGGQVNLDHQAAAYEAFFKAFWAPAWDWFEGVVFWDVSIAPSLSGPTDASFSPLGKPATEAVLRRYLMGTP